MPIFRDLNDSIAGAKLYCVFERRSKPARVSTTGRHNAQQITLEGNPAVATVRKTLKYIKE
jgi:hypothetical protein